MKKICQQNYIKVTLSEEERQKLEQITKNSKQQQPKLITLIFC